MADAKAPDSVLGLFLRLYWMLGGNAILAIAAAYPLAHTKTPVWLSLTVCCLISISIIAARYIDIRDCGGQTVDGDPADLRHLKRYAMIMLPVSVLLPVGVWAIKTLSKL